MISLRLKIYLAAALLLSGGVLFSLHRMKATAYDSGYRSGSAHVADSLYVVREAESKALRDSLGRVADSLTLVAQTAVKTLPPIPKLPKTPQVVVTPTVALDSTVSVWVESAQRAFPLHVEAARVWAEEDSILTQVALPMLERQRSVIVMLDSALTVEKQARSAADTLTAVYAKRNRELNARIAQATIGRSHPRLAMAAKAVGVAALVVGVIESPKATRWAVSRLTGHR